MASTDVLVHINMNGNEIQNVVAQNLATAPNNPREGQFYYNSTDKILYVRANGAWVNALAQGTTYTNGTGIIISNDEISVDFNDVATAAQGALADTALQPNDNISELTNNVGYITSSALSGYVPTSRKINGKALTADITLNASDVSALPSSTTINDLTTTAQQNALNSGATTTNIGQIATNTSAISTINGKIPSQASSTNQLADKNFVNSSIQTATANFRGNWATWAAVPSNAADYPADYAGSTTPTVNDYLVVQDASGYTGETLEGTWRFKYSGVWGTDGKSGWLPEYQVNETPLTSAQLAALNSGATTTNIAQITTNANNIANLQATAITASSTNTLTNKTIDADDNTISDLTTSNLKSSAIATSISVSGVDTKLATEKAVRDVIQSECVKVYSANNPALTASGGVCTWNFTHGLDYNLGIHVYNNTTGEEIVCSKNAAFSSNGSSTVKINSTSNIAANTYRVVVFGLTEISDENSNPIDDEDDS